MRPAVRWNGGRRVNHALDKFDTQARPACGDAQAVLARNVASNDEKPLLTAFNKPQPKKKQLSEKELNSLIKPSKELIELRKKVDLYGWGIIAAMTCNHCLPGIALMLADCIYFFGLRPLNLARQPLEE